MADDVPELYQQIVRRLSERERLQLAALILNDISQSAPRQDQNERATSESFSGRGKAALPMGRTTSKLTAIWRAYMTKEIQGTVEFSELI